MKRRPKLPSIQIEQESNKLDLNYRDTDKLQQSDSKKVGSGSRSYSSQMVLQKHRNKNQFSSLVVAEHMLNGAKSYRRNNGLKESQNDLAYTVQAFKDQNLTPQQSLVKMNGIKNEFQKPRLVIGKQRTSQLNLLGLDHSSCKDSVSSVSDDDFGPDKTIMCP